MFKVSYRAYDMIKKVARLLMYIGLAHTTFECISIFRVPEASHHWYYGLLVPGLNYGIPLLFIGLFLAYAEKQLGIDKKGKKN